MEGGIIMKKLLCLFLIAVFCLSLAACQLLPDEPSSDPVSQESSLPVSEPDSQPSSAPETETSTSQISGGIPLDIDSNVAVKFNWLEASFVDYAEEHLGYDPIEKPVTGSGLWDILSLIEFLGYTKDDFIAVNNTFTEAFGRPEYTDEEIDILFGEDERAKRELVSPYCIFIGEGPITIGVNLIVVERRPHRSDICITLRHLRLLRRKELRHAIRLWLGRHLHIATLQSE